MLLCLSLLCLSLLTEIGFYQRIVVLFVLFAFCIEALQSDHKRFCMSKLCLPTDLFPSLLQHWTLNNGPTTIRIQVTLYSFFGNLLDLYLTMLQRREYLSESQYVFTAFFGVAQQIFIQLQYAVKSALHCLWEDLFPVWFCF